MNDFLDIPQPEAKPDPATIESPSLWLYVALLLIAVTLIVAAFSMQDKPDWPGLLLNLAAGLIGTLIVLVFVDRRLRARELAALRLLPGRATWTLASVLLPTSRFGVRYARRLLVTLEPLIEGKVVRDQYKELDQGIETGFLLLARPGEGKTTWLQIACANLARHYLLGSPGGRLPVLLSLRHWLPERPLDEALHRCVDAYAACSERVFRRFLASGRVAVLLDGYDEIWGRQLPFDAEVSRLREEFPLVAWTITSRPEFPSPQGFGEAVKLAPLTENEISELRRRRRV